MFAELQMKLTDQFRAESDAKEAEISALKVHVSVLQTALDEMRRDLDETSTLFSKPTIQPASHSNITERNFTTHALSESDGGRARACSLKSSESPLDTCDAHNPAIYGSSKRIPPRQEAECTSASSPPLASESEPRQSEHTESIDNYKSQTGTVSTNDPQEACPQV